MEDEARPEGTQAVLPYSRDQLGRFVREAWVEWARTQPDPKPSWLVPYDDLAEPDKEADRRIGEHVARLTMIGLDCFGAFDEPEVKPAAPDAATQRPGCE